MTRLDNPFREDVVPQRVNKNVEPRSDRNEMLRNASDDRSRGRPFRGRGRGGGGGFRGGFRQGDFRGHWKDRNAEAEVVIPQTEYQCEACERLFFSSKDLDDHLRLHVKCRQCKFSALQQLVDLHVKLVHDKHLASRVMEQSPEEIAEYIAERKRRYPKKKTEDELEEGECEEKMDVIHEGNVRGNKRGKFAKPQVERSEKPQQQRTRRKRRRNRNPVEVTRIIEVDDVSDTEQVQGVVKFSGVGPMRGKKFDVDLVEDDIISDTEDLHLQSNITVTVDSVVVSQKVAAPSGLACLMCYTDSEEEVTDMVCASLRSAPTAVQVPVQLHLAEQAFPLNAAASKQAANTARKENLILLKTGADLLDPTNDEVKRTLQSLVDKVVMKNRRPIPRKHPLVPTRQMPKRKLSLLENLLAKDIRHERNIILQCVDFVVKNDFFEGCDFDV